MKAPENFTIPLNVAVVRNPPAATVDEATPLMVSVEGITSRTGLEVVMVPDPLLTVRVERSVVLPVPENEEF